MNEIKISKKAAKRAIKVVKSIIANGKERTYALPAYAHCKKAKAKAKAKARAIKKVKAKAIHLKSISPIVNQTISWQSPYTDIFHELECEFEYYASEPDVGIQQGYSCTNIECDTLPAITLLTLQSELFEYAEREMNNE